MEGQNTCRSVGDMTALFWFCLHICGRSLVGAVLSCAWTLNLHFRQLIFLVLGDFLNFSALQTQGTLDVVLDVFSVCHLKVDLGCSGLNCFS